MTKLNLLEKMKKVMIFKMMATVILLLMVTISCEKEPSNGNGKGNGNGNSGNSAKIIAQGNCGSDGDNLKWILTKDSLLTITGNGAMQSYGSGVAAPWYEYQDYINTCVVKKGVTSIGSVAFFNCYNMNSVTIPNSVTSISMFAFWLCSGLTSITNQNPIPIEINEYVFLQMDRSACTLKVPAGSVSAYKNANVWKDFKVVSM